MFLQLFLFGITYFSSLLLPLNQLICFNESVQCLPLRFDVIVNKINSFRFVFICILHNFLGIGVLYKCMFFFSGQAGDLYEKIRNNQRALECFCKGGAFRKGKTVMQHVSTSLFREYKAQCI